LSVPAQSDLRFFPVPVVGHMYIGAAMSRLHVSHAQVALCVGWVLSRDTDDSRRSSSEARLAADTSSA
ncbi:hypothetical protein, partial [Mycobacteroides abscessus]|uniref:hypothetical protein n=1 Tax=Mycobacteroides abscessus TaxID=36809 RepID=UPI001A986AA0